MDYPVLFCIILNKFRLFFQDYKLPYTVILYWIVPYN